jgi:hypothetical protein
MLPGTQVYRRHSRREGTMSISTGHRAIVSAFGWGNGPARVTAAATFTAAPTAAPAAVESGALVCSPWEGLYLEQAQTATPGEDEGTMGQQLESFLSGLMYGE